MSILIGVSASALAQMGRDPSGGPDPVVPLLSPSEMRADRLDRLFAQLHKSSDRDAKTIEENIWKVWMASDSPSAELVLEQATKAMSKDDYVRAIDMLTALVDLYPDYAEAWNKRATIFYIIGRNKESLQDIEKVLELEPRHFGALSGRGMIYEKEGEFKDALDSFKDALAVNPHMRSVIEAVKRLEDQAQAI